MPKDVPIRTLNEVTETLLFYKLGELGMGPKMLGTFDGGRIEEYIVASSMSAKDFATNENVARALAKVMARYHRIDIPIKRQPWNVDGMIKSCYSKFQDAHPELSNCYFDKGTDIGRFDALRPVIEFNVIEFNNWISKVSKLIKTRIVLTHNDSNRSNIMINGSSPNLDSLDLDQRLLLIDCEFSGYSHRGQDIGNAFGMRKWDFAGEKLASGYEYPNEHDQRIFIESYVEDMRSNNHYDDWDENGIDSVDHIMMETEFGSICVRFINIVWGLRDIDTWINIADKGETKLLDAGMNSFPPFINARRKMFVEKYPQYA